MGLGFPLPPPDYASTDEAEAVHTLTAGHSTRAFTELGLVSGSVLRLMTATAPSTGRARSRPAEARSPSSVSATWDARR